MARGKSEKGALPRECLPRGCLVEKTLVEVEELDHQRGLEPVNHKAQIQWDRAQIQ